ncbi:MAG: acetyl-CoA carboxylase biotin carboxyl carrier protein subunit [Sulfitobacter sp.]|uniref:acetyl-CoA carboxylase biotin carboxyl carrier protein subunit n=1 Tax=Alphaproteobacteria TaxID=28211 RepID=UPI002941BCAE|nr:acetyl-CoA carboxylase biotin carboxyl carrier protein subunit [Sulfitobacter sp. LC.270.F.C4]WOI13414.1 acetyl-CoA carboxylase biotin carboxyl carrier protein subunit [Sulfitobacter sp. LC.270.F.C4]
MAIVDVVADITGNVWKVVKKAGDIVEEDEPLMILESMKMEIPVQAPDQGKVVEILVEPETVVTQGQVLARIEVD